MGRYSVMVYDGSIGDGTITTYIAQVTVAVAKSICRHFNREIYQHGRLSRCQIDIQYYMDCPDFHDPGLDYWR